MSARESEHRAHILSAVLTATEAIAGLALDGNGEIVAAIAFQIGLRLGPVYADAARAEFDRDADVEVIAGLCDVVAVIETTSP